MINDRELLKLAAKALDNPKIRWNGAIWCNFERMNEPDARGNRYRGEWNPLTDDGDAFRLMIDLDIDIYGDEKYRGADAGNMCDATEPVDGDIYVATRRAIVRAAAEVGKAKV